VTTSVRFGHLKVIAGSLPYLKFENKKSAALPRFKVKAARGITWGPCGNF
jgi:hypothetical protein